MLLLVFPCIVFSQENVDQGIKLNKASIEQVANSAVWRTDYYICTGIAYAKSLGKSVDDFARFVGREHSETVLGMKGRGLEPVVQMFYSVGTNYSNGEFEILFESDSLVNIKTNRPWETYFKNGPMVGITQDEFEQYLLSHLAILLDGLDIEMKYEIENDSILVAISTRD